MKLTNNQSENFMFKAFQAGFNHAAEDLIKEAVAKFETDLRAKVVGLSLELAKEINFTYRRDELLITLTDSRR